MYGMKTIFCKEMRRVFKDRRMIISLFILPVILVIGMFGLMSYLISMSMSDVENHIPNIYIENAPAGFVEFMDASETIASKTLFQSSDANSAEVEQKAKDEIYAGDCDLLVIFPEDFEKAVADTANIQVPDVKTFYNPSEDYSKEAKEVLVGSLLENYRLSLLEERYGTLDAVQIFSIDAVNEEAVIQDEGKAVGKILGMMLPYFITMLIFATAMSLGIDMISGEKERGTLATMLLTPVNRTQIVMGKILSLATLSVMSAAVYIITMVSVLPIMMGAFGASADDTLGGLSFSFSGAQLAEFIFLLLGVVLLYVSIICFVAVLAKNVKEGSTYILPAYLLVIVAGFITMYASGETPLIRYFIPVYGSSMAFKDILTMELQPANYAAAVFTTYVLAGILVLLTAKEFNNEKRMFNA